MALSCDPAALARALLSIAERAEPCRVTVVSGARRADLVIDGGRLCAVHGVAGEPLGDTLLRHGVLDLARHAAALPERDASEPVGHWLVRVGAANAEAVRQALTLQAIDRLRHVLAFPAPKYVLRSGSAAGGDMPEAGAPLAPAVWLSLHRVLERQSVASARAGATRLSDFGERLGVMLRSHGLDTSSWQAALEGDPTQASTRATLDALGATRNARALHGDAHGLLLRKRGEVRRGAPPHVLLDLSRDATPVEAKRAFRRLVRELHPDRFGTDNAHILACSSEVVRALSQAVRLLAPTSSVAPPHRCAVR